MDNLRSHRVCAQRAFRVFLGALLIGLTINASGQFQVQAADGDRYQSYEIKHKSVTEAGLVLEEMLEGFEDAIDIVADPKSNRLLVSGPEKAHRIITKVLRSIDVPASAEAETTSEPVVKSYACSKANLNGIVAKLRERYSEQDGVRIAGYSAGERLLILAPPEVHEEIQILFAEQDETETDRPATRASRPAAATQRDVAAIRREPAEPRRKVVAAQPDKRIKQISVPAAQDNQDSEERFVGLTRVNTDAVVPFLKKTVGLQLEVVGSSRTTYRLTTTQGLVLELALDRKRRGVLLTGDPELCNQMALVLESLDEPNTAGGDTTTVLPLHGVDPSKVQDVQSALRVEPKRAAPARDKSKAARLKGQQSAVRQANGTNDDLELSTIRLAANQQPTSPQTDVGADDAGMADEIQGLDQQLRRFGPELEVEVLPDLDVIIIRGNKNDVREMTRILKELERLSVETEPTVEVYPLQHVRGDSLAILIEKVNTDLTGGLRGRVTVTPLIKPNALLIIGWGDTVDSVRELIAKLDQPIPKEAQFQIFRLKHADAQTARTTVQEFFTARNTPGASTGAASGSGLAPRVQITADSRTNSLIIQAAPRDLAEVSSLIEELDVAGGEVVHQARIFKLKNTLAADLAPLLQSAIDGSRGPGNANAQKASMLEFMAIDKDGNQILKQAVLTDVKITPDPHTNSLLVSASPESMELIAALIKRLDDTVSEGAQIKVFRVYNGDATSLVGMLRSLLPPPNASPTSPQLANSRDETSLIPVRFSVDLRTNSIIATGATGDLRIIEALLLRLDQRDVEQRKNQVYRLKNAPANAVAKSVNDFLRSERTVQQAAPGAISPFQQIESEVVVVPEPVSNSLIISATPRFFDEIEKLVVKLDAEPPQVMIQVMIAQVSLNNTNEFGVELGIQDSVLFDRSLLGNLVTTQSSTSTSTPAGILTQNGQNVLGATNTPGFNFNGQPLGNSGSPNALAGSSNVGGQAVSNFGVGSTNSNLGYGGLVLSASSENVSVLIRALRQSNRLEVLSRPQIRTLDNQPAYIQIGQKVPRLVSVAVTQVGSTNGVVLENVGLILGVTPRISPEGMVVMEVDAEKSEVDLNDQGIPVSVSANGAVIRSPLFNVTTASTTVSALSGETIIIGGLITKSNNDTRRRVPVLSDIPILGNLFRYDSVVATRSELLIILTPHVIRSPEESARIKRAEVARMHWCAGDVVDVYGPGVIDEEPIGPFGDTEVPIIYPDTNPRGSIRPPEIPPQPQPPQPIESLRGQVGEKTDEAVAAKNKQTAKLPIFSGKKRK